jgi:prephenate dehydrogenase
MHLPHKAEATMINTRKSKKVSEASKFASTIFQLAGFMHEDNAALPPEVELKTEYGQFPSKTWTFIKWCS